MQLSFVVLEATHSTKYRFQLLIGWSSPQYPPFSVSTQFTPRWLQGGVDDNLPLPYNCLLTITQKFSTINKFQKLFPVNESE
jgi:hypothetical protein